MTAQRRALLAIALSLLSALFFTATYVLNRAAAVDGGHWAWTASLRYLFVLPLLLLLMPWQGGTAPVAKAMRVAPGAWLLWSGIGFVLFYMLLSYAAASGPSWLDRRQLPDYGGGRHVARRCSMTMRAHVSRERRWAWVCSSSPACCLCSSATRAAPWMRVAGSPCRAWSRARSRIHWAIAGCCCTWSARVSSSTRPSACSAWPWPASRHGSRWRHGHGYRPVRHPYRSFGWPMRRPAPGWSPPSQFFQATGMVRDNATDLAPREAMQAAEVLFVSDARRGLRRGLATRTLAGAALVVAGIVLFAWIVARDARREAPAMRKRCCPIAVTERSLVQRTCASQSSRL